MKNMHIRLHQTWPSFAWKTCPSRDNGPQCGGCREMIEVIWLCLHIPYLAGVVMKNVLSTFRNSLKLVQRG